VYSKTGTAEVASDPMPQNASDAFIILKPRDEWPDGVDSREDVLARIDEKLGGLVGNAYETSQPIELRFNELIAGVRGDIAVKVFGDDMDVLNRVAGEVAAAMSGVEGTADLKVEQTEGFPTLEVQFDREAIARYGLAMEDVTDTLAAALGGREAGLVCSRVTAASISSFGSTISTVTTSTWSARFPCSSPKVLPVPERPSRCASWSPSERPKA
jgi:heavy metal efflux system protein